MKKFSKHLPTKSSRKLALEANTIKQLSGDHLTSVQGGVTQSHGCSGSCETWW